MTKKLNTIRKKPCALVQQGNAAKLPLRNESVDLIVTSPPYFALRDYKDDDKSLDGQIGAEATPDEFLQALWDCSKEWWRVLAPGGSLWVNLGDKYNACSYGGGRQGQGSTSGTFKVPENIKARNASGQSVTKGAEGQARRPDPRTRTKSLLGLPWRYAIGMTDGKADPDGIGWVLRAEVIWAKPNGLPESVRDRVARKHEQWFHFTKSERYYSAVDTIREAHSTPAWGVSAKRRSRGMPGATNGRHSGQAPNPLGKLPGSVWTVPTEPLKVPAELGVEHFAAFPSEFPRRIILGWAPTKGVCTTCGEGLAPVTTKTTTSTRSRWQGMVFPSERRTSNPKTTVGSTSQTTITGWTCACDAPGPTRRGVVLDPFGGTGTTAAVAKALGCVGISVDLSASYTRLAHWRTNGDGYARIHKKVQERMRRPGE